MRKTAAQSTRMEWSVLGTCHHRIHKPQAVRLHKKRGGRRSRAGFPRAIWLILISAILISMGTTIYLIVRQSPSALPNAVAKSISGKAFDWVSQHREIVTTGPLEELVRQTGEQLASDINISGIDWRFILVRGGESITYVLPDGTIFIHADALLLANKLDDLAALLAHQIAHVAGGHIGERVADKFDADALDSLDHSSEQWPLLLQVLNIESDRYNFSKGQEASADLAALGYMRSACFQARQLPLLWQRMQDSKIAAVDFLDSVHPHDSKSLAKLGQDIEELGVEMNAECKR